MADDANIVTEAGSGAEAETQTPTTALDDRLMAADLKARMFGRAPAICIGRFAVQRKLGEGGMGVVYAARDVELDRPVALKILHAHAGRDARLMREARALAKLNHPNVVTVHDVGEVDGRLYLAMELVEGETLRRFAETHSTREEIIDAYVQAATGLHAAHAIGIVHRDFKPDNAIMGTDGRVRVLDFGLARETGPATASVAVADASTADRITVTGGVRGTPAYMAPEQILGRPVDPRCDQFAFCVALFEALAGQRPFAGDTVEQLLTAIVAGNVRDAPSQVPASVVAVLRRGLAAEPEDRFEDLQALVQQLRPRGGVRGRAWFLGGVAASLVVAAAVGYGMRDDEAANGSVAATVDATPSAPPYAAPEGCPPFRDPGLDASVRAKRLKYLERMIAPLHDDDAKLPDSLLWVAELELQAGELVYACGALDRLHEHGSGTDAGRTGACWRDGLCRVADVVCPPGFAVDGLTGCAPVGACDLGATADPTAASGACVEGDAACCAMDHKLRIVELTAVASSKQDAPAIAAAVARLVETSELGCALGHASICAYAATLHRDGDPAVPDDPMRARDFTRRACDLGHVPSCR